MGFSVTNNYYLRTNYGDYRDYSKKSNRTDVSTDVLNFADASALRKAVRSLMKESYDSEEDISETTGKVKTYAYKMKAFVDSYNYTVSTAGESSSRDMQSAAKKLKKLVNQYSDELDNAGIRVKSDGTMEISASSSTTSTKRYESIFGSDSKFMKKLDSIANSMKKHVDVQL